MNRGKNYCIVNEHLKQFNNFYTNIDGLKNKPINPKNTGDVAGRYDPSGRVGRGCVSSGVTSISSVAGVGDNSGDCGSVGFPKNSSVGSNSQSKDDFSLFYTNSNSLFNKLNKLRALAADTNFKVICITESHLSSDILDAEIGIANYNLFRCDRIGGDGGGSVIYVHNTITAHRIDTFIAPDSLAINLDLPNCPLTLTCVYRSQSLTDKENAEILKQLNQVSRIDDRELLVVGDFNLPDVCWDSGTVCCPEDTTNKLFLLQKSFLDEFLKLGLDWTLSGDFITRRRLVDGKWQESLLDQILTTNTNIVGSVESVGHLGKSDHVIIICNLKIKNNPEYINTVKQNWFKFRPESIRDFGYNIEWGYSSVDLNVEQMWAELHEKLLKISSNAPKLNIKCTKNGAVFRKLPWDCSALKRQRKLKNKSWGIFDKVPTNANLQQALHFQEKYETHEIKAMVKYEKQIVANMKTNPKRFFGYLNSKRKIKQTVTAVKNSDGLLAGSAEDTANILAEFFSDTFTKEPLGPLPQECYKVPHGEYISDDLVIQEADVKQLLSKLDISKSMGPDMMHPKLLATLSEIPEFITALTILFNQCFKEGRIPSIWKTAHVTPLHKKGSVSDASNYRPISLTSIVCKTYEKIIRNHILAYVENQITEKQHGFMSGRSCLSNLLESLDVINDMLANGEGVDIFFLDFQKAFDSVPHHRLLVKLQNLGITGKTLAVISDFLSSRSFNVTVGNSRSKTSNVASGVPQGSVLGPLLFLLYINDLPESVRGHISLFADDVKMIGNSKAYFQNQIDLNHLSDWQNLWLLKFNTTDCKCKVMYVGKNNPNNLYLLNGAKLPSSDSEVDLGVSLNSVWNFSDQIHKSIKKANACIGWVNRSVICRSQDVMNCIYKSMIRPHLEYCVQLWAPQPHHNNWTNIMNIENIQRKFTRMIEGLGLLTYEQRLENLGLTTLLERRARGDLIETFKIINGFTKYGKNLFRQSSRSDNLLINVNKNHSTQRQLDFLSNRVVKYWNKLPAAIRLIGYWDSACLDCWNALPNPARQVKFVNSFKHKLETFKLANFNKPGHYWELSQQIFDRLSDGNRQNYVDYMLENPDVAKRRRLNITHM